MTTTYYSQQAKNFAKKFGVKFTVFHSLTEYRPYFTNDKEKRYVFKCRLSRGHHSYAFSFGQSIAEGCQAPDLYSVLACLQKYEVGTFEDFCREFGYESFNDDYTGCNKRSMSVYKAVKREYNAVMRLFGDSDDCLDALRDIE